MTPRPAIQLTCGQSRLLTRHRRGLARLARVLAEKTGGAPTDVLFLLAHQQCRVARLVREQLGVRGTPGVGAIVVPGLAIELPAWVARLALAGAVVDCRARREGVSVIVVDDRDATALCTFTPAEVAINPDASKPHH